MTPGDLERALRESLTRRAATTPPPGGQLADAAIRRARVVRRRRAMASALALVLVTAGGGAAMIHFAAARPAPGPEFVAQDPEPFVMATTAAPATEQPAADVAPLPGTVRQERMAQRKLPVDVVVGQQLLTVAGAAIDLAPVGDVQAAYRAADGWLVLGRESSLWYAMDGAAPHLLIDEAEAITVQPAGRLVAWRDKANIYLGDVVKGHLIPSADVPAPDGAAPVAFVGKAVLLARQPEDSPTASYAVWWPGKGEIDDRWRESTGVYGVLPDERTVVAQIPGERGGGPCLALLDAAASLAIRAKSCDLPLVTGAVGWLSPDGHWLVAQGAVNAAVMIDVSNAFGDREPAIDAGPGPSGPGAWTDSRTVVHGGRGHLVRLRLDRAAAGEADAVEQIPVQGGGAEQVLAVPKLN